MKALYYQFIFFICISLVGCTSENENPLAGSTWEMVSGKYSSGESTFTWPMSKYHKAIQIWGKTHLNAIWQDSSKQESFFVGHIYTIEHDSITFTIKFIDDIRIIGRSLKVKYEIKDNQLILSGTYPFKRWGIERPDLDIYEIWKRID